jgi:hypothetical protein
MPVSQQPRLSFGEPDSGGFRPNDLRGSAPIRHFASASKSPNVVLPSTSPSSYTPMGPSTTTSSYQTFSGGGVILHPQQQQQQQQQQHQMSSNPGYLRRASYPGPMAQQQPQPQQQMTSPPGAGMHHSPGLIIAPQQQQQQHPGMTLNTGNLQPPAPHLRRASGNNGVDLNHRMQPEEKRSLLQQLLSE